jgi:hypothetical protein
VPPPVNGSPVGALDAVLVLEALGAADPGFEPRDNVWGPLPSSISIFRQYKVLRILPAGQFNPPRLARINKDASRCSLAAKATYRSKGAIWSPGPWGANGESTARIRQYQSNQ